MGIDHPSECVWCALLTLRDEAVLIDMLEVTCPRCKGKRKDPDSSLPYPVEEDWSRPQVWDQYSCKRCNGKGKFLTKKGEQLKQWAERWID